MSTCTIAKRRVPELRLSPFILNTTLATCSDALIMLSATPHDGRPESFASLINMLDTIAIAKLFGYPKKITFR
ncbi:hypothetical protein [Floridanema aerugineum]|uniref:Uncharacterized protein n=1 Tax=Floridaenema aerugineum BLCC-F46 TaxID=3153654 RepID=A0ABV4X9K3_9CYAN